VLVRTALMSVVVIVASVAAAARAASPPVLTAFGPWAGVGSRIAFVGTVDGRSGLWTEGDGTDRPRRIGPAACVKQEEIDELAAGPRGTWACLERTVGNTESYYSVDVVSSTGASTQVAAAGGATGDGQLPVDSIPQVFGDGNFLGYLHLTVAGAVQLFQITSNGNRRQIADLPGVSAPQAVAVANGALAILQNDGSIAVFTTGGKPLATIGAHATSIAIAGTRIVARTRARRLAVYGLRGGLVHSWPLRAESWTAGLATDGRYAFYLGANKALHGIRLSNGNDRVVARAGSGWFFNGVALGPPGVVAPLTREHDKGFSVTLRLVPRSRLAALLG
jgi:hypothetical protein